MRTAHLATAVPWRTGLLGLAGFFGGLAPAYALRPWPAMALLALLSTTGLPMLWAEWKRTGRIRSLSIHDNEPSPGQRRKWRLRGLLAAAPLWAATLYILPLASSSAAAGFWTVTLALWPLLLAGLAIYIWTPLAGPAYGLESVGRWMQRPEGMAFPWHVMRDHLVKAFFLPLMISFAYEWIIQMELRHATNATQVYAHVISLMYLADTVFATIGYLSTSRALDAHVRSSNHFWLGWASALICYPPFFTWLQLAGVNYRDGFTWSDWLPRDTLLFHAWGGSIVLLTGTYALSTVAFGIRFSNLTNRGIITHGPYRWSKHPAYLSKNLSWWLISIPFISSAGQVAATMHCLILLGINMIYWVRAKTEEKHLMEDPAYRLYADWIAEHGLFARAARLIRGT